MSGGRQPLGAVGEHWAEIYLRGRGYTILHRNWRCRWGEVDLIAANDGYIAFVEVKARKARSLERPLEAVSQKKQERLHLTAEAYLVSHPEEQRQPRMDVCAILAPQGTYTKNPEITYLENAF